VQVPAGRRFRRSVVRPAFGQASSASPRLARHCTAPARARTPAARGCSSPAAAAVRRLIRVAPVGMPYALVGG
jgi:hypothetical protein